jgi:hypothetical protein
MPYGKGKNTHSVLTVPQGMLCLNYKLEDLLPPEKVWIGSSLIFQKSQSHSKSL